MSLAAPPPEPEPEPPPEPPEPPEPSPVVTRPATSPPPEIVRQQVKAARFTPLEEDRDPFRTVLAVGVMAAVISAGTGAVFRIR